MENKTNNFRIKALDGFRTLAILMVMLFHYFTRWIQFYPYGSKYDFFSYGKLGVHFFFIISGFVILYTLENTDKFMVFWIKRMIRLLPAMLMASIITFFVFNMLDKEFLFPNSHLLKNVLASITFIPPDSLASVFNDNIQLDYVSGSYWSLWPEIQFYLFVSIIYFLNKRKFSIVFFCLAFIFILSNFILHHVYSGTDFIKISKFYFRVFNLAESLPYFCFGVLFYFIYKNQSEFKKNTLFLKCSFFGLLFFQIYVSYLDPIKLVVVFVFLVLFYLLIFYPKKLRFLENKLIVKIGVSSYFLYLIHENIGVLMIHNYGNSLKSFQVIAPLLVIMFLIIISILFTYFVDKKISNNLKRIFLKN